MGQQVGNWNCLMPDAWYLEVKHVCNVALSWIPGRVGISCSGAAYTALPGMSVFMALLTA